MRKVLVIAILAFGVSMSAQPARAGWLAEMLDIGNAVYCNSIGNIFRVAGGSKQWGDDFVDMCTGMWYQ